MKEEKERTKGRIEEKDNTSTLLEKSGVSIYCVCYYRKQEREMKNKRKPKAYCQERKKERKIVEIQVVRFNGVLTVFFLTHASKEYKSKSKGGKRTSRHARDTSRTASCKVKARKQANKRVSELAS